MGGHIGAILQFILEIKAGIELAGINMPQNLKIINIINIITNYFVCLKSSWKMSNAIAKTVS